MTQQSHESLVAEALAGSPELAGVEPQFRTSVAAEIARRACYDSNGRPTRQIADIVADMKATEHWWWQQPEKAPAAPTPKAEPAKSIDLSTVPNMTAAILQAKAAAQPAAHAPLPADQPNPWKTGNMTQQCLVMARDPALAARLQREAGK